MAQTGAHFQGGILNPDQKLIPLNKKARFSGLFLFPLTLHTKNIFTAFFYRCIILI